MDSGGWLSLRSWVILIKTLNLTGLNFFVCKMEAISTHLYCDAPLYRWGNWGSEKLICPRSEPMSDRVRLWTHSLSFCLVHLTPYQDEVWAETCTSRPPTNWPPPLDQNGPGGPGSLTWGSLLAPWRPSHIRATCRRHLLAVSRSPGAQSKGC